MAVTTPGIEELRQMAQDHLWLHARSLEDFNDPVAFKVIASGNGCWLTDVEGRRYLDALSGLWLKNIGYGRLEIAEAVYEQMKRITYVPGYTGAPTTIMLADKVASLVPDKESRIFFCSGGSEAIETAVKLAKSYHKQGGKGTKFKVISRYNSYHGATAQAMSLGGGAPQPVTDFGPLMIGNVKIHNPNNYKCPHSADHSPCTAHCARELEWVIQNEGPETVAAFVGEPVSAASGIHVPDPSYWPTIREICDKYDVVLICDEVINGFGRTGRWFASEHWNIKPDIITVAKALTGGYLPVGAAIASKKISQRFEEDKDRQFRHLITYGGHPVVAAAALANLEIIERERVVQNAAAMGDYLLQQLQGLYEHPMVGQVRGIGLLAAVELVKDRKTKEPLPQELKIGKRITEKMDQRGIMGRFGDVVPLAPPLVIKRNEVDILVKALDESLGELERELDIR